MTATTETPQAVQTPAAGTAVVVQPTRQLVGGFQPQTAIAIAIDTQYVASVGSGAITKGIYMFDNRLDNGSKNGGGLELSTVCNVGDLIGFEVYPIDQLGSSGDSVAITGFNVSQGSVFGSQGYPMQQQPNYWIGQAMSQGTQTYQIRVLVKTGGLRPTSFNIYWDPFITAQ